MKIGIMSALHDETSALFQLLGTDRIQTIAKRDYHCGKLFGVDVVLVFTRVGKVAASTTATTLIHHFGVDKLIFTGVAGAISSKLAIGDIVIADQLIQHDIDARPIFPQYEIPYLDVSHIAADKPLTTEAITATNHYLSTEFHHDIQADVLMQFNINKPTLHTGTIACGDQFISDHNKKQQLANDIDNLLCVEMEGAAVAQVCYEHDLPFSVIRTISDNANHTADIDFLKFVKRIASHYSAGILKQLLGNIHANSQALDHTTKS